jgi:branched-subunit amino acid aminotransferase/4-amino-4-deoxychorismate lyase
MIVYYNGVYLPKEQVSISPDDRGFLFSDGAYKVIRSYNGRLFQLEAHINRLERSITELRIDRNVKSLNVCHFERSEKYLVGNILKI